MSLYYLLLLAIVQGITEFLPISSSGHLILLHEYAGVTADALALDVAVHLGSILAVILYFRAEVARALRGTAQILRGSLASPDAFLALALAIATIPALVVGAILAFTGWIDLLRSLTVIGWMMIIFGIALYWIDVRSPEVRHLEGWTLKHAVRIGLWQAVALIPGVSRSGITITAARSLGYARRDAARIAMLMSMPITLATGAYLALGARNTVDLGALVVESAIGAALAFVAAYGALALMMRFLPVVSFTPYVVYRVLLGVVLLGIAYT